MHNSKRAHTILLVDDDEVSLSLQTEVVEFLGYKTIAKNRSYEALLTFLEEPLKFDLVITDDNMPGMQGLELAQELLRIRADIPIIMYSGSDMIMMSKTIKIPGICAYLGKPCSIKELSDTIHRVLNDHGSVPPTW